MNQQPSQRGRALSTPEELRELLLNVHTVAVLGIKTEQQADQPAFYVPAYVAHAGIRVYPVPVYYPEATKILGQTVYRTLAAIPERVDLVNVFRRPSDLAPHLEDVLAANPRAVWLQQGIREESFAEKLLAAGIDVVQDRCLMVELRSIGR